METKSNNNYEYRVGVFSKGKSQRLNDDYGQMVTGRIVCIAIADGVGESKDSKIGAQVATEKFLEGVKGLDPSKLTEQNIEQAISKIWEEVGLSVKETYEKMKKENPNWVDPKKFLLRNPSFLATTLIGVIETDKNYIISYLGNGSIWHIKGDFWKFLGRPPSEYITNLLRPLINEEGELTGFIDHEGLNGKPSTMEIGKNHSKGEIIILTTDGVSSAEKIRFYSDTDKLQGRLEVDQNILNLLSTLKQYLEKINGRDLNPPTLSKTIEDYLNSKKFMDDATIGIIISDDVIIYFRKENDNIKS